jgi:hypothetical protein
MRLQTMTLPTGEFIFVIDEAPGHPEQYRAGLKGVKNEIGAAAVLVFEQRVDEIADALSLDAHRVDAPLQHFSPYDEPREQQVIDLGGTVESDEGDDLR